MNNTLNDLTEIINSLYEMAYEEDVDLDAVVDTLDAAECSYEEKADAYCKVITHLNNDATAIDTEIKRLQARKKAIENRAENVKSRLESSMISTGMKKIKTALFSMNIQKNPPSVYVQNEQEVIDLLSIENPELVVTKIEQKLDKKAIKELLTAGEEIPGCSIVQTEGLRIR